MCIQPEATVEGLASCILPACSFWLVLQARVDSKIHLPKGGHKLLSKQQHFMACRRVEDFELHKQLYKGKASLLYSATCKRTGIPIALKLYRKGRLSELNWHQASPNQGFWPLCL